MAKVTLQFLWRDQSIDRGFRTGVSLHSHTMYSEESLNILSRRIDWRRYLGRQAGGGIKFEFPSVYWTPPLSPHQAYRVEERQIQNEFQLPALISLTDHDDIQAGTLLRVLDQFRHTPISTEWSVPFGPTFFHLGVHNLPSMCAKAIMAELSHFTAKPNEKKLYSTLAMLNSYPETLIVLNHPLWDEKGIGYIQHAQVLTNFLQCYRRWVHGIELNGLRPWSENRQAIWLGREMDLPVVSGGDRHGLEANSILNLSHERTFAEFIYEVRYKRRSHVVFMPQCRESHKLRILRMVVDVLRDYPEHQGRVKWSDRVLVRLPATRSPEPLSSVWCQHNRGPKLLRFAIKLLLATDRSAIRWAVRLAFRAQQPVWAEKDFAAFGL